MNNEIQYEEVEVEESSEWLLLYEFMKSVGVKIQKKRTELFKDLVVSFRKSYPLSNFVNNDEGPIIDINRFIENGYFGNLSEDTENYSIDRDVIIKKAHCPICGFELKEPFTIKNYYEDDEEHSSYFNQKVIYLKNTKIKAPRQISFNYISCSNCLRSIVNNYNKSGKPLVNSNLLDLYVLMGKYLGLELAVDLNSITNARCIYPVDRIYFRKGSSIFYFNLFILASYGGYKFKEYWDKIGKSEEDYSNDRAIVFTEMCTDLFDPNKFSDFREFETWLKSEVDRELLDPDFTLEQLKGFKIDVLSNIKQNPIIVQCEKNITCKQCSGRLSVPTLKHLFSLVPMRKDESICVGKKWEIEKHKPKTKEREKKPEVEEEQKKPYMVKEEISTEEVSQVDIIKTEKQEEKINMGNDQEGILSPEEEAKLNQQPELSPVEEIKTEVPEEDDIGEIPTISSQESLITPLIDEEEGKNNAEETNEKLEIEEGDKVIEEVSRESFNTVGSDSDVNTELGETTGTESVEEERVKEEPITESDNAIFEKAIEEQKDSILNEMLAEEPDERSASERLYDAIMEIDSPSQEEYIKTYNQYVNSIESPTIQESERKASFHDKLMKGMDLYVDYRLQDIYKDYELSGKEALKNYPNISYEDLQEYIFDKMIRKDIEESRIENNLQTRATLETDGFNYKNTLDEEDEINQSNEFLKKNKEKQEKNYRKAEEKCNVKAVFRTKDIKVNNPFVMQVGLKDNYNKSPFRVVMDMVMKMDGYRAGNPIITIEKNSLFVPIIDFADVGIRFVCIDTSDTKYWTFQENPVKMVNRVPFPNSEFASNHSLNFLYSNECLTNPQQVAFSIFKLVNRHHFPENKIVRLAGRNYPIAFTTEKQAMIDFEHDHSIFSGIGKAKNKNITLIAFVDDDNENRDYQIRRQMAERMSQKFRFDPNDYVNTYKNLLDNYQMCYILSAHYLVDKEYGQVNGREEAYIHYTITQYTENIYCIIEDGLPALISAIVKEHYREYPNMSYSISFEFDRTALISPSVRKLLNNTQGIFNLDPVSIGQTVVDTNTNWVISESRFQRNSGLSYGVDDRARQDYRMFLANEVTLRNFLANKIRPDENLSNVEKILSSVGYFKYPEPKAQVFELTTYALELIEKSPLFMYMFPIEIGKLNQDNAFDSYNRAYQELLTAKFMMANNLNVEGSREIFEFIDQGAKVVNQIVNWMKNR